MCTIMKISQENYNEIASHNPVMYIGEGKTLTEAKKIVDQGFVSSRLMRQAALNHGKTQIKYYIHSDEMAELGYIFAEKPFTTEVYAFDTSVYNRNIRMRLD
jgi:hypothetical protein